MILTNKNIEKSLLMAKDNRYFEKLNHIYSQIPEGICSGCTNCCMESVNTSYTEFLYVYNYLKRNKMLDGVMPRITTYYFMELMEKNHCPFLNEQGKCDIYHVRPLTCRLFGYWDKKDFENNLKIIHEENKKNAIFLNKKFQIKIPDDIVSYTIPYCKNFKKTKTITKKERTQMADDIFSLDVFFLMKNLLTEDLVGTNLITWFIYMLYNQEQASSLRIQLAKEYQNNGKKAALNLCQSNYRVQSILLFSELEKSS